MMYNGGNATEEQGKVDKLIVLLYLLFVVLGWLNIYAASFNLENAAGLFDLYPGWLTAHLDRYLAVDRLRTA